MYLSKQCTNATGFCNVSLAYLYTHFITKWSVNIVRLPNGYGSVTKLSGRRRRPFMIKKTIGYDDRGHPIIDIIGYAKTREEGLNVLAKYNDDPDKFDRSMMTTKNVIKGFKTTKKYITYAESTKLSYETYFKKLEPFHNVPYRDIKGGDMQIMVDAENTYSSQGSLRNIFKALDLYAMSFDIIDKMYSDTIDVDETVVETTGTPFTEGEIETLWKNQDKNYVGYILIMLYSGFRIGALLQMKLSKVNLEELTFQGGVKSNAGRNRIVPIHSKISSLVEQYVKEAPGEYLFYDRKYKKLSPNQFRTRFYNTMDDLKMNHKPHDTRHTFRSRLDSAGAKSSSMNLLMGHAGEGTGERVYTHKSIEELQETIELLD